MFRPAVSLWTSFTACAQGERGVWIINHKDAEATEGRVSVVTQNPPRQGRRSELHAPMAVSPLPRERCVALASGPVVCPLPYSGVSPAIAPCDTYSSNAALASPALRGVSVRAPEEVL